MSKLVEKNPKGGYIIFNLEAKYKDMFYKNLKTALRKFTSGKKTRSVSKLVDSNSVYLAIMSGESNNFLSVQLHRAGDLKKLVGIGLNIHFFDDSFGNMGSVGLATKILGIDRKIQKEKSFISEKQLYNISILEKQKEDLILEFLRSLNYIKMIDGIYFAWLIALSTYAVLEDKQSKPKIVTTAADILSSIIKKIYRNAGNSTITSEVHQLIDAISIYFIRVYFYEDSAQTVIQLLKKAFKSDYIEAIQKTKITKFKEFNDIATILNTIGLIAITKETFDMQMRKFFGKYGYEVYIQRDLANFIAFMANLATPNQLFKEAYGIDQESHERLEQLLLNEKRNIIIEAL